MASGDHVNTCHKATGRRTAWDFFSCALYLTFCSPKLSGIFQLADHKQVLLQRAGCEDNGYQVDIWLMLRIVVYMEKAEAEKL